jgi:hypothetical protein
LPYITHIDIDPIYKEAVPISSSPSNTFSFETRSKLDDKRLPSLRQELKVNYSEK